MSFCVRFIALFVAILEVEIEVDTTSELPYFIEISVLEPSSVP